MKNDPCILRGMQSQRTQEILNNTPDGSFKRGPSVEDVRLDGSVDVRQYIGDQDAERRPQSGEHLLQTQLQSPHNLQRFQQEKQEKCNPLGIGDLKLPLH